MEHLSLRIPDDIEESPDKPPRKKLKVTKVVPFGLFLEDGGFVHISKVSSFHHGEAFKPRGLEKWYPVGASVLVQMERKEQFPSGETHIYYDFFGPGQVVDGSCLPQSPILPHGDQSHLTPGTNMGEKE